MTEKRNVVKWVFCIFLPRVPMLLLALPLVILMRLLSPIIKIRLIPVSQRLGHGLGNIDIYLHERMAGLHVSNAIDIFYSDVPWKCNRQMIKMWKRLIPLYDSVYWLAWLNLKIPGHKPYHFDPPHLRDVHGVTNDTPPPASFTLKEEERGARILREMGIPFGSKIVCFQARDSSFLNTWSPGSNWDYHSYRDADINSYTLAIKELVARGYYCIRMGRIVNQEFLWKHPQVIDYATSSWRSDFADFYLLSRCHFYIGTSSGVDFIASFFRKPQLILNMIPMANVCAWSPSTTIIFKKNYLTKEKRSLTFKEIMTSDISRYLETSQFKDAGIEVIDNTPEEILDAVIEKEECLRGCWKTNDECEELQGRFWDLYKKNIPNEVFKARAGAKFLLQNKDLL